MIAALLLWSALTLEAAPRTISLAGPWRVSLDAARHEGADTIRLPGSLDEAKLGQRNTAAPTLDGLYRLYYYEGPAFYTRDVEIPPAWSGKRVTLFLERAHWTTTVWLDGALIGSQDSLIAPHLYALPGAAPGKHHLVICVDNTKKIDLGRFVSINYDGTQTNWNGLIGALELRAADPVSIVDLEVYPDVARKSARVRVTIANATGVPARGELSFSIREAGTHRTAFEVSGTSTQVTTNLPVGDRIRLWDEFSPALYELDAKLTARAGKQRFRDQQSASFGMRELAVRGTQFTMNGRALYLRGTLECAIFPRTGYPPTDVESWRRIYRVIKSYGLNHMRFHSWCPPDAAFAAADLEGVMLQAEGPQANVKAGADPKRDAFIEQEFLRIVRTYGNHPSFALMTLGNEYGGPDQVLSRWVDLLIREDSRHLYSSASSAQKTANRQFTVGRPRGVQGPGTDADFRDAVVKEQRPLVGHEIAQWTFFPNFDEMPKYSGVLAPRNFELVRESLEAHHLADLAPRYVEATGRHAVLLYKEEMEVLMRSAGHAGFQLLDLHDYPGQGTALIGLLDPFWESKGFVTPEEHRRYAGSTVPLLRMKKRTYTAGEPFRAAVEVAHFGPEDLAAAEAQWTVQSTGGQVVASGTLPVLRIPTGQLTALGSIDASFASAAAPAKLVVTVSIKGTPFANSWDVWVYPAQAEPRVPAGVMVSRDWDEKTKTALASGARVVLLSRQVNASLSLPGKFLPVFWSPVWFPKQQPNTMGILCDPKHPLFAGFPTEAYSNWQWYELLEHSRTLVLDEAPPRFRPIVQVIDNFVRNQKLGNVLEARVGEGRLLLTTIDLPALAADYPAARQLLAAMYGYAASDAFRPREALPAALLDRLLVP